MNTRAFKFALTLFLAVSLLGRAPQKSEAADNKSTRRPPWPSIQSVAARAISTPPNLPSTNFLYYNNYAAKDCWYETRYLTNVPALKTWSEISKLDSKLSSFPTDSQYYEERAKERFIAGEPLHALSDAQNAVAFNPFSGSGHVVAALSYYQLKDRKSWLNEIKQILPLVNEQNVSEVEYAFGRMDGAKLVDDPEDLLSLATVAKGKTSSVIEQRLALWIHDVSMRRIAYDLFDSDWKSAANYLEVATSIRRDCYVSHLQLGICYLRLNQLSKAETSLRTACRLAPKERFCHLFLSCALDLLKRPAEAKVENDTALELARDWMIPYNSEQTRLSESGMATFDKCFVFMDQGKQSGEEFGMIDRGWYPDEKCLVRFMFTAALKRAPGLVLNASAGAPIKLVARTAVGQNYQALFSAYTDTITCTDPNFALSRSTWCETLTESDDQYGDYFHELSHLCSSCGRLSSSTEWLDKVHPFARKWLDLKETMKREKKFFNLSNTISCGLPSYYATTNPEECLAEYSKQIIFPIRPLGLERSAKYTTPPEIKKFLEAELLHFPNSKLTSSNVCKELCDLDIDRPVTDKFSSFLRSSQQEQPRGVRWIEQQFTMNNVARHSSADAESLLAEGIKRASLSDFENERRYGVRMKLGAAWMYLNARKFDKTRQLLTEILELPAMDIPFECHDNLIDLAGALDDSKLAISIYEKFGGLGYSEGFSNLANLQYAFAVDREKGPEAALTCLRKIAYAHMLSRSPHSWDQDERLSEHLLHISRNQENPGILDFVSKMLKLSHDDLGAKVVQERKREVANVRKVANVSPSPAVRNRAH